MHQNSKQSGFTMIEILIVISIISVLFVTLAPQVSGFFIKANQSGLKTDFRTFLQSSESYLRETKANNNSVDSFNKYLDSSHNIEQNGSILQTKSLDPWGNHYYVNLENGKIEFSTNGENESTAITKYSLFTYYYKGIVDSCTNGFPTGNVPLTNLPAEIECGDDLPVSLVTPEVPVVVYPPNEPTNFRLNIISANSVNLAWNSSTGATSYILKRNGIIIYEGNAINYLDSSLSEYTAYNYSVFARNSAGDSSSISIIARTNPSESTVKLPDVGTGLCHSDPYIISTVGELQGISLDLDACFELGKNIDASLTTGWNGGLGFVPIKNGLTYFTGELDGKGYAVTNLFINRPSEDWVGLFNSVDNTAIVKDLTIKNANITGSEYVGILTGYINKTGSVSNIDVQGSATGKVNTGGLAGLNIGNMYDLQSHATVSGHTESGGLVGANDGTIKKVHILNGSSVLGEITIGGVIGFQDSDGILEDIIVETIPVSGGDDIGGLAGANYGTIVNGESSANVIASNNSAGGVVGYNTGSITTINFNGVVTGVELVGGIAGYNSGNIANATSDSEASGSDKIGGIVGYNYGTITETTSNSKVLGAEDIGGIAGKNNTLGKISKSRANGNVTSTYNASGGVVGFNQGIITTVHSSGAVVGINNVGGAVGYNSGKIENSYSLASVSGTTDVGGFNGRNELGGSITYVYANGLVTGTTNIGGLVGRHKPDEATINFGYYDQNTTGRTDTGKGIKKLSPEMKTQGTYVGWNFATIWQIDASKNNGYPLLK